MPNPLSPQPAESKSQVADTAQQPEAAEQSGLQSLARRLAGDYALLEKQARETRLLDRLEPQADLLADTYQAFRRASDEVLASSYTAEWLLDNYYIIQQAERQVEEDLPANYYHELPRLDGDTIYRPLPRIYMLARELLLYEECQLDLDRVSDFITAYQDVKPLRMGEIWAFPIMLRFGLLESLAQTAGEVAGTLPSRSNLPEALHFRFDAEPNHVVGNCIISLRFLATQDWADFFEAHNVAEQILRQDPMGVYAQMEFDTRDDYRKVVEELAQHSSRTEVGVAETAIALSKETAAENGRARRTAVPFAGLSMPRQAHVGYYLLGEGRRELEQEVGYLPEAGTRARRLLLDHPTLTYVGGNLLLTGLILAGLVWYALRAGANGWGVAAVLLLGLLPATLIAVGLVNWLVTLAIKPRVLPKLDLEEGVPYSCRTMVTVPSLLSDEGEVDSLLKQLELHYLRNPDPQLGFALLTDFGDAEVEQEPDDQRLLERARQGIRELNAGYSDRPFYLFHRRRLWNPREGVYMGWERKRGKLHEFNRLLRGATDTSFVVCEGDLNHLEDVQYVITLDADTILPRDAAARLVGTLAHPLNRAHFDDDTGRVTAGYTVLQPRTEIVPTSANQSLFTRIFGGDVGIDLYSRAVSDVYQDLFGEGTYVGKGIYDVDAFERSLAGRVPENALLSHDLFEGINGRAALVTDVVLYEEYPPHYLVHVRRSHRWIRGDWQLLPWLLPRVPTEDGRQPNRFKAIEIWKLLDNLRRSLVAPGLFALFVAGWTVLPGSAAAWTLFGLVAPAVSLITSTLMGLLRGLSGDAWGDVWRPIRDSAVRWLLQIAFLPFETLLSLDAILTTLWRLLVTRKDMLQWTTAAHTARLFGSELSAEATLVQMLPSVLLTGLGALLVILVNPGALPFAAPLLVLWILASELAHRISRPAQPEPVHFSESELRPLRLLGRRTWLFFEHFVGPDDNWLPPDHFQEHPRGVVAHRTSPTNVGLYLLAVLAAYDMGYIGLLNLNLRVQSTFDTLVNLGRYRGHFLNWITTNTLQSLPPDYVSTVDSGNLAGCLWVLKQACLEMPTRPLFAAARWTGLEDTCLMLDEAMHQVEQPALEGPAAAVRERLAAVTALIESHREDPASWGTLLLRLDETERPALEQSVVDLVVATEAGVPVDAALIENWRVYLERIRQNISGIRRDLDTFLPWVLALEAAPARLQDPAAPLPFRRAWDYLQARRAEIPAAEDGREAYADLQVILDELAAHEQGQSDVEFSGWVQALRQELGEANLMLQDLLESFDVQAGRAESFVQDMDFAFLYNKQRHVFHIGYNVDAGRLDNNYYDLLASEARIASLVAIAKGDVPQSHWLHLSRPVTESRGGLTLLSWSGTMFEYLMPALLMRSFRGTLLAQSERAVIEHQIAYGREHGLPWGISESGFYTFDNALNYQYRAFGVPGLGFKRGLGEDCVLSPYASLLALPLRPAAVADNMRHFDSLGMLGRYGYYEAIDFTEAHLEFGQDYAVVQSYMAHHQGMIMLAVLNFFQHDRLVERFHAEPRVQAVELLLQEQVPAQPSLEQPEAEEDEVTTRPTVEAVTATPWKVPVQTPMPQVHYLSNGRFGTLITNAGSGYSAGPDHAYTRWRPDTTLDNWGVWIYLQEPEENRLWSVGLQPAGSGAVGYEVTYFPHMARFHRRDFEVSLVMDVVVAPDADVEIRRVGLTNDSDTGRRLRLTSYGEVVLAPGETDARHQAFAKLFVESEYLPAQNMLLFRRRPRKGSEAPLYMAHMLVMRNRNDYTQAYESDRAAFLGRGGRPDVPAALAGDGWLQGVTGATLDPIMSLGQEIELAPRESVDLAFVTFTAADREGLLALAERYRSWSQVDRAFPAARAAAEQEMRRLKLDMPGLERAAQMLGLLLYPHRALRPDAATLAANTQGQPGLWAYGISGDYPVLLLRLYDDDQGELLQELVRAHRYWRRRGLQIDLVILNMQETNYGQPLHVFIQRVLRRLESDNWLNRRGGIFLLRRDQLGDPDYILLQTVARVILDGKAGSVAGQLSHILGQPAPLPRFTPTVEPAELGPPPPPIARPADLLFDNGYGGFSPDGQEYVMYLPPEERTPAPWINVVANEQLGFLASESGGGYTWAENSGENRLTSWRNDPVTDEPAEVLYLRDEETAEVWTPTPLPTPADAPYLVRHGPGYTVFEHNSHHLKQRVRLFVDPNAPVKIIQLRLENASNRTRRITATFYAEWVLGTHRGATQPYLIPTYRPELNALFVRNPYSVEFSAATAFLASNVPLHGLTANRTDFMGRLGTLGRPAALQRVGLSSGVSAGLDTCAALQVHFDLPPGESQEVSFLLGQASNGPEEAEALIRRMLEPDAIPAAWEGTHRLWDEILGAVQVDTPDPAMNLLLNRWLLYQALACRIWGRSALYQSSGAYGFRDQLQDVMSVLHSRPDVARTQILRAARHQFEAGDVLHWWHPPSGRGVRTRITDDLVWLPYVTAFYVNTTGDASILDQRVPFLTGEPLPPEEEERYGHFPPTQETFSLYEHCCRVLQRAATTGRHGLPLMGAGDWNDGMNRVGIEGEGESVWLAWFLVAALRDFAGLAEARGDVDRAQRYREQAAAYAAAVEETSWDGAWYRRAYYDDGTPLGSRINRECQIDSLGQSWAVLTGAADPERAREAMESVRERLVRRDERLILLFTPPFDKTPRDPGYIKGYLPGIRENGGQYTHAALWTIWAFAQLGEAETAEELFRLISPIYRSDSQAEADLYKVEPYVVAADVYGVAPHEGRGGWTWYTGSSGWMYRLGLEGLLGLRREGDRLRFDPRIPGSWPGFSISYRYGDSTYRVRIHNPHGVTQGVAEVTLDGTGMPKQSIPLSADGKTHQVEITLGG